MNTRHTFTYIFYLRREKGKKPNEVPIYMRITVDGTRSDMSINRTINPIKWIGRGGFVTGSSEKYKNLNQYLDYLRAKVYEAQSYLLDQGKLVTGKAIKDYILDVEIKKYTGNFG